MAEVIDAELKFEAVRRLCVIRSHYAGVVDQKVEASSSDPASKPANRLEVREIERFYQRPPSPLSLDPPGDPLPGGAIADGENEVGPRRGEMSGRLGTKTRRGSGNDRPTSRQIEAGKNLFGCGRGPETACPSPRGAVRRHAEARADSVDASGH